MSSSRDTSRRFRIRSLRFWKMVQRKEGRSCRKVRMDLKDGYIVFVRVLKKKKMNYTYTHTHNQQEFVVYTVDMYGWEAIVFSSCESKDKAGNLSVRKDQGERCGFTRN